MMVYSVNLVKSTPLRALCVSFQYFVCYKYIEDVHELAWCFNSLTNALYFKLDQFLDHCSAYLVTFVSTPFCTILKFNLMRSG